MCHVGGLSPLKTSPEGYSWVLWEDREIMRFAFRNLDSNPNSAAYWLCYTVQAICWYAIYCTGFLWALKEILCKLFCNYEISTQLPSKIINLHSGNVWSYCFFTAQILELTLLFCNTGHLSKIFNPLACQRANFHGPGDLLTHRGLENSIP